MKTRKNITKLSIIIFIIAIILIAVLAVKTLNQNNTIYKQEESKQEQLTQTTGDNSYMTVAEHLAETSASGSMTMTLLWENSSPTTKMVKDTTITLSSDDYNLLLVQSKFLNNQTDAPLTTIIIKGASGRIMGIGYPSTGAASVYRGLTYVNNTTYTTGTAEASLNGAQPTTNNAYLIPYRIYGIK